MARKATKQKKRAGRPTKYTQAIADEICVRLEDGESLRSICRDDHMPNERTVRDWTKDSKHPISPHYAQARQIAYLKMADELVDIADDGSNDYMMRVNKQGDEYEVVNHEHIQRSRLRVDTRKWVLSKMLPKVYGDKVVNEITGKDGGPVEVHDTSSQEVARRIAFVLARAAEKTVDQKVIEHDGDA